MSEKQTHDPSTTNLVESISMWLFGIAILIGAIFFFGTMAYLVAQEYPDEAKAGVTIGLAGVAFLFAIAIRPR